MPDRRLIANAVLFQLGWLACVLGGNSYWLAVPLVALLVHFFWTSSWAAEGKLVASVMLAGAAPVVRFLIHYFAGDGSGMIQSLIIGAFGIAGAFVAHHCAQLAFKRIVVGHDSVLLHG